MYNYGLELTTQDGKKHTFWYGGNRLRRDNMMNHLPQFSGTKKVKGIQRLHRGTGGSG